MLKAKGEGSRLGSVFLAEFLRFRRALRRVQPSRQLQHEQFSSRTGLKLFFAGIA
jgi:hypothetical protein